jgi:exodeoxyribonuclease V alpha subunit
MALSTSHAVMLTRNLVYTGLTRAQELAVLVGERRALHMALPRTDAARRHTRLTDLVAHRALADRSAPVPARPPRAR